MTTTTTTTTTKRIQISLSERAPVRIAKEEWPMIAAAEWFSGQHECQANETAFVRVRQHQDGRRIVYGLRDRGPGGMAIGYRGSHAGYLLDGPADADATVRAIRRVAGVIDMPELGDECIADLPAEEI